MKLINYLQFILFILCFLFSIYYMFIIFRKNDIDYDSLIDKLNDRMNKDLELIKTQNEKLKYINSEIKRYNEKLGTHFFEE